MNEDKDALIYLADVRIDELEAENAKLRELVRDMWHDATECGAFRWRWDGDAEDD